MVRLNRIYTKTGDDGTTGLGDGTRLPKHHLRIEAYGTVDELSSVLGGVVAGGAPSDVGEVLVAVQNDLFDLGADLCIPPKDDGGGGGGEGEPDDASLRVRPEYVAALERHIDAWNADLAPLTSFVLPGGSPLAARLHLARTVCRRAERLVSHLTELEPQRVNPDVLRYLNRLSDLLFVLARVANDGGKADVLWRPGARQTEG